MRWGFRWVTATKGSERERLLASDLSVVRGPKAQWDSYPKLQSPPLFLATPGGQMGPIRAALVGWLSVAADADSDPPREYRPQPRAPLPFSPNSACTAHHAL